MGMVGGAVGVLMFLNWYGKRRMITMVLKIQEEQKKQAETEKKTEE